MRICYFGTWSDQHGYPMNRALLAGLEAIGVEVVPCHARVWADAADKMAGVGLFSGAGRLARLLIAWLRLAARFARLPDYDVLLVGYIGHIDIFLARFLTLFRRRPVVLNALVSLHDTVVTDRQLVGPRHPLAALLRWIDRRAFAMADRILIDTDAHARHLSGLYGVPMEKWIRVPVGADPDSMPERLPAPPPGPPVTVLYFGTYIALHGVPTIIEAARRLAGRDDIRFVMLGRGQELPRMRALAQDASGALPNMRFDDRWVDRAELLAAIAGAHVCLGVFAGRGKGGRVIPCKVYDALAMGRPVVTADTPGVRELLTDGRDAVLVPPDDPEALAAAIEELADQPERRAAIGTAGAATFREAAGPEAIGRAVRNALAEQGGS